MDDRVKVNGERPQRSRRLNVWDAVRHRPLWVLGAPLVMVLLTVAFVLMVDPVYESSSSIRIDEERSGVAMLEILQSLSSGSEVYTEMAVLRSRSLAEDVVRALDLQLVMEEPRRTERSSVFAGIQVDTTAPRASYVLERTGEGTFALTGEVARREGQPRPFVGAEAEAVDHGTVSVGETVEVEGARFTLARGADEHDEVVVSILPFQEAVKELQASLDVTRPDREADVVVVRYRASDPELTRDVPNALAAHFLVRRQAAQSAEARSTVDFLEVQIDTLELQLAEAEEGLRDFREANAIVSVEAEADAQVERLAGMQAQRDLLGTERQALQELLTEISQEEAATGPTEPSPFRKLVAFPTLLKNGATAELLAQLGELENRRAELLQGRTPEDRDVRILSARIRELEDELRTIAETYLRGLGNQVGSLNQVLASFQDELSRIPAQEMTYIRLRRQAEILSELYTLLQTKQKEAQIAAAVQDQSVRVVDPALYPVEPVRPKPWLSLLLGVVLGVVVGVGGAVAAEHMDASVRNREELQAATGAAVLGLIPTIAPAGSNGNGRRPAWVTAGRDGKGPRLVGRVAAGDPAAEAYRSLRTNINFSRPASPPKVLVFTSPMPGDGKSTTAGNLALVLAQQGGRVLLMDADMRRGVLHEVFGADREPGLSNALFGSVELEDAVTRLDLGEGHELHFLSGGTRPPNPAELLSSDRMERLLSDARDRYDTVILDAPPLNLVTDAALLGARGDGVVLVARAGATEEAPLHYAVDQLERVRAPLLGTVLNGVDERRQSYYGSQRGGAYGYFQRS